MSETDYTGLVFFLGLVLGLLFEYCHSRYVYDDLYNEYNREIERIKDERQVIDPNDRVSNVTRRMAARCITKELTGEEPVEFLPEPDNKILQDIKDQETGMSEFLKTIEKPSDDEK